MRDTNKVAVLGDADFVMPFSALGVDTYPVGPRDEEIIEAAKRIIGGPPPRGNHDKYALVVVAENKLKAVEEIFSAYQNMPTVCIVAVPFTTESQGLATRALGQMLKIATGVDILRE